MTDEGETFGPPLLAKTVDLERAAVAAARYYDRAAQGFSLGLTTSRGSSSLRPWPVGCRMPGVGKGIAPANWLLVVRVESTVEVRECSDDCEGCE